MFILTHYHQKLDIFKIKNCSVQRHTHFIVF